ncbi:MAG: YebC/PmpR family DNA-binding transcriptional regulator [Anaerolineaceae bacterium]|nr:YebC/PmpR family DNA-binding transcriptional regulator [Anaerolineaceae bacterium]
MSGHSKWATIKRKKGAEDAKRGKVFTRLTREIVLSAREGGGDINTNFKLRLAVDRARAENMPKDNIERAIRRGTGEDKDGVVYEQVTYEGYAHNAAMIVECVTENRNRTVAEVRHGFSRAGGSLGESGSVSWQFTQKSYFTFPSKGLDFDEVFMLAAEGGAEDITEEDGEIEIIGDLHSFKSISDMLQTAGIKPEVAELRMFPNQELELSTDETLKVLKTVEFLEELDDVQAVYHNIAITDDVISALED